MRLRLEATSVYIGIGPKKAVERTGIQTFTSALRYLEFLPCLYLLPGQLVNSGYATGKRVTFTPSLAKARQTLAA